MSSLSISFLGPPRFVRDQSTIAFMRAKGIALLLYLAVTRVAQPRERVLDLLWPESLPQAARKNMRNTLWAIGDALGDDLLEQDSGALRLAPSVVVDLHAFEDGLLLLESGAVAEIEAAVARYHGPLADGLVVHEAPEFEIWLATERERLASLYLRLLERTVALRRAAGDWQAVAAHARRALAADPLREAFHLALIEAQMHLGQRAQAIQQYAALNDILRRELDVAPLPETVQRYEALLSGIAPQAPPWPAGAAGFPQLSAAFVGRKAELAALDQELARTAHGLARVVLIAGDLGMGKTQLWRSWAASLSAHVQILATHALETGEPVPFGPLLSLLRHPGPVRTILERPSPLAPIWLAELARLLPELAASWPAVAPPLALSPAEERARLLQALTEVMRLLARPQLILVIDDLHWADPSTLDWLVYLVDHLHDLPLLLIGTYRPQDAPERLLAAAAGWQRQGQLRTIALAHLTTDEAHALLSALGAPTDHEQAAHWVRQSGGNPYFLLELHRAESGEPSADLAALVRARIQATVPASAIQVLQAAAVLGDEATFATLQATSGRSEEETLDALDALDAAAVLVPDEGAYRFIHPLVAAVVQQDLAPARRAFLHRRAALALERAASHPGRAARQLMEHYAAAGDRGQAAHYAERAAEQALALGAAVEAAAYARRALGWEPTPRRQLLVGDALMRSGSGHAAQIQLEAALQGFEQADEPVGIAQAGTLLAMIAIGTSRPDVARRWLSRVPLARIQEITPELGANVYLLAASVERQSQAYDLAVAQFDYAAELARQHRLTRLEAHIAFERGNLLADRGDRPAAIVAFREALRLASASESTIEAALAHNNLAYHLLLAGDISAARAHIRPATELAERYAVGFLLQYVYSTAGEIALAEGQLDQAEVAFARAFEAAHEADNRVHMANLRANQALVALERAEPDSAQALLAEARALFGDALDPFVRDKIAVVVEKLASL
ncbi:MAG TPA: AAA family ATPase [Roseiflexaceae bacterium]|nr:AAA family ATPase [Roseiflexaceae bacterium]